MICGLCGRKLKNAKSKELGYGPVCYRKAFGTVPKVKVSKEKEIAEGGDLHDYIMPGQMEMADFLVDK